MLFLFIKERLSWILLVVTILIFSNVLFYLDSGLSNVSISYFNIVNFLLCTSFFIWRYIRETRQLKHFLGNISNPSELNSAALSPFQQKYFEKIIRIFEEKEQKLNDSKIKLQQDAEDLLAWVHEMKTPLTAMKLILEQMEDNTLRNKIEKEWLRLHLLLDQQIYYSRLDSIEKDNRLERVQLKPLIYHEIKEYQSWCMEKGIGFELDNLKFEVITDKKWLSFIIRQLLSNAIKYSKENSEIKIYLEMDTESHLLLHIQDYGIGIRQEDLPRIFEKSYTGTTGRINGNSTGMGLYLTKNAANKLGIELFVQSKLEEGSTFTLKFPLENEYVKTIGR